MSTLKARPGSPLEAGVATGFDAVAGGLKPRLAATDVAMEPAPARVTLPATAANPLHLEDATSNLAVDVSLRAATDVAAQAADGYVVYPNALAGATVLHRVTAGGTEDYVALDTKPAATQVTYDLALGAAVAGLRLVAGTLEVLDVAGAPRLRVTPPFIVGADGVRTDATLAVAGCTVDTSPAAPWGRAVTAPGARTCQVKVSWPERGIAYPALLDPRWTTTGSMTAVRQDHTMTLLTTGKVLATGGRSTTGTTGLPSAELYDKTTGTWAVTMSMTGGRFLHRATQLNTGSNPTTSGKVLISGGLSGTTSLNTALLYNPTAGTWASAANLNAARHAHTETRLADGRVLVSGGMNGTTTLQTAALYNPASGSGSWAATTGPIPPPGWRSGTATLIQTTNSQLNNKVLLVGGNNGSSSLASVFLFDPAQSAFSTLESLSSPREQHTAVTLPNTNGKVLVAGGKNGSTVLATVIVFDPGSGPGSWSSAGTMTSARVGHSMTLLPASIVANGQVLVAGGSSTGSNTLSSAELFSGTSTWTVTPAMPGPAKGHTATLLGDNMVLIAGGLNGTTVLNAARLYDAAFGLGCSSASQCPSGFCVNGVCCNSACNGGCGACNLAGQLGTCTALTNGTTCRASAGVCDPAEACNGSALNCPADGFASSSTVCRASGGACDPAENCTGTSAACPNNEFAPASTVCRTAVPGGCDVAENCTGTSATCPNDTVALASTVCRAAVPGGCDVAENCTGTLATCPNDVVAPASTVCRAAVPGGCDVAENCTGTLATCPNDVVVPASTVCRTAVPGGCDVAESCNGSSAACPGDTFAASSTVCRAATGDCDLAATCTGSSTTCPPNSLKSPSTVCREAAPGGCDVAESCTGSSEACPADGYASNGAPCSDGDGCTQTDSCQGGACTGSNPVTCVAQNECHGVGTCNSGTGACSNPTLADGTLCTGGVCQAGNCQPNQPGNPPSAINLTTRTDLRQATAFLYEGPNPQQIGVAPGTIKRARVSIFRGKVLNRESQGIPGVIVRAVDHPEYGYTQTGTDGVFSMAVNGGELLRLDYQREGYLPIQRTENAPVLDYAWFPDVVMTQMDPARTIVDLSGTPAPQVAIATPTTDASGPRQQVLLFASGTQATVRDANGTPQPISTLSVHATEYSVGPRGPDAMPAPLPPSSGYTYAVEFSVEEAMSAADSRVEFSRPVISYVDNFLHFPAGTPVPVGTYDRAGGMWIPAPDGRVIRVLGTFGGLADLDTNGDDAADDAATLAALGIDDEERTTLASLYLPGEALWRVPVSHFTPYDCNWPFAPPEDFTPPDDPKPKQKNKERQRDCFDEIGSAVACSSQTMSENVAIVGTPLSLSYTTARSPAYGAGGAKMDLTVSGASIPSSVKRIDVTTSIAGRVFHQEFAPAPNLKAAVSWDGTDAFGRAVAGRQPATVRVRYAYDGVYGLPRADIQRAFAQFPSGTIDGDVGRAEIHGTTTAAVLLDHPNAALEEGLGGWTLSAHHTYDPRTLTLTRGDNGTQSADAVGGRPAASVGHLYNSRGPQGNESIWDFQSAPNGSIYLAINSVLPGNGRLARLLPDGTTQVDAVNLEPRYIAIGGNRVFFSDHRPPDQVFRQYAPPVIKELKPDGSLVALAGSAAPPCTPDQNGDHALPTFFGNEGPAIDACLEDVQDLDIAPDGSIYVLARGKAAGVPAQFGPTSWQIRKITSDGTISKVLSGGHTADDASVDIPDHTVGSLAIASDYTIYLQAARFTVQPNGSLAHDRMTLKRLLADGSWQQVGFTETGGPQCAPEDLINGTRRFNCTSSERGLAIGVDGTPHVISSVIFIDPAFPQFPHGGGRLVKLRPDGLAMEAFGGGFNFSMGRLRLPPDGSVLVEALPYLGLDAFGNYYGPPGLYRLRPALPSVADVGYLVPSEDGSEIYSFDVEGRHLRTYDATGAVTKLEFHYDSHGFLTGVTDRDGRTTTIERASSGSPTAIVSPTGQRTTLGLDGNGYLNSITSPGGAAHQFQYADGAITEEVDPRNGLHQFTYDGDGRLISDRTPTSGTWSVTQAPGSEDVTILSPEGTSRAHSITEPVGAQQRTVTSASGLTSTLRADAAGGGRITLSDGMDLQTKIAPDPRFGVAAPYVSEATLSTPGGLKSVTTTKRQATFAAGNPLSLSAQTDTVVINGRTTTTVYEASSRTTTMTSPAGRVATVRKDDRGRPIFVQRGTLAPTTFTYDSQGRKTAVTVGTGSEARTSTAGYDAQNRPTPFTDPASVSSQMTYDANNQLTSVVRAGSAPIALGYNAGDLTSVTPPGRSAYTLARTAAGDGASYSVPLVGSENPTTGFEYDLDRRLTRVLGPDGTQTVYGFEAGSGRLATITYAKEANNAAAGNILATMGYSPTTGKLESMTVSEGPQIALQHDGDLPLLTTWSGVVTGSVSRTYNNDFFVVSESVDAGHTVSFGYDADGLVTTMGALTLTRDAPNGLVTDTTLASITDHSTYTSFAEPRDYEARHAGASLYHADYQTRDVFGRVETKVETVLGETTTCVYGYDTLGRLTQVMKNGSLAAAYGYDVNGNRTSAPGLASAPTYDAQDRLLVYGNWTFTYTAGGDLLTKTDTTTGALTRYHYDGIGSLRRVELPDGRVIDYVIDPVGRRVGKKVDGVLVKGWLYAGDLPIVAELDGSGAVLSRFVGDEYMVRGGATYRLITDEIGSVRLVVDVATGAVAQRIDYDEFGRVLVDTAPGFQPLGFAGGLYDPDTGLVRFGARDYDAAVGRWTARDPVLFDGGDTNLYVYVGNDPINATDPTGLTRLFFDIDAGILFVDPEDGRQVYEIKATSGDPDRDCMNRSACKDKDAGPIPSGKYKIKPRSKKPFGVHEHRAPGEDWGSFRTRLIPSGATRREITRMGRDPNTFYLHGGSEKGTEGCVDVGGGRDGNATTERLLQDLILDPDNNVPFVAF